ncbi:MAG: TetR family transcriptional regulator [Janthinobacterium lividum]
MKRAYGDAGKDQRRKSILDAAALLLRRPDGGLPSAAEIAAASGLAKGTLYIYFRTKEEIFAALLLHLWEPALAALEEEFMRTDRPVPVRVEAFVLRFVAYVDERPFLLRLDALAKEVIERNMSVSALIAHKEAFLASIEVVSARLENALMLQPGRGFKLLTRTHAMMRGLWQSFGDPIPELQARHHHAFATELSEALLEYWKGALSS